MFVWRLQQMKPSLGHCRLRRGLSSSLLSLSTPFSLHCRHHRGQLVIIIVLLCIVCSVVVCLTNPLAVILLSFSGTLGQHCVTAKSIDLCHTVQRV